MPALKIKWEPKGNPLAPLDDKKLTRLTDGDTPYVEMSIRMLSIDTPEVHYPGTASPAKYDAKLKQLAVWLGNGTAKVYKPLADYLIPRLEKGDAGTLQKLQGDKATAAFGDLQKEHLALPNGKQRNVFIWVPNPPFEEHGRLLAYLAPNYSKKQLAGPKTKDRRSTFNLMMIENGWAAPLLIYPSLPGPEDLKRAWQAAKDACDKSLGAYAEPNMLTGYEFRMCCKLWDATDFKVNPQNHIDKETGKPKKPPIWIDRWCADMSTGKLHEPQRYVDVEPYDRLFIWSKDKKDAVKNLELK
jgi:endonuclease YncB( thermonuclease family)